MTLWCWCADNWRHTWSVNMVGGYLSAGDVDRCHDVCSVSIKAPDAAGHGRAHQVLVDVQLHQSGRAAFQHLHKHQRVVSVRWFNTFTNRCDASGLFGLSGLHLSDHLGGDGGLAHGGLPPTHDPVYGSGLLVGAVVPADRQHLHIWILLLESVQRLLGALRTTAHASGFTEFNYQLICQFCSQSISCSVSKMSDNV